MNINNVPSEGQSYDLKYLFTDGVYSREVGVNVPVEYRGWITATINNEQQKIHIDVARNEQEASREGAVNTSVDGNVCNAQTIHISQEGGITPPPVPTGVLSYDQLREQFNPILTRHGYNELVAGSPVDNYLSASYDIARAEYAKLNSPYFTKSTYEEVFRNGNSQWGSNAQYETDGFALNAMTSWLMAMQLAELVPDSGVSTNTQTELYAAAYNVFRDDSYAWGIPLYNHYTLKGDPSITRLVAGALYSTIRANYNFSQIDFFRGYLGGSVINNPHANSMLGFYEGSYGGVEYCLSYAARICYCVNANHVLPPAAGPYVSVNGWKQACAGLDERTRSELSDRTYCNLSEGTGHCSHGMLKTWVGSSYFNSSTNNYTFDETIDDYVTTNYNLTVRCDAFKKRTVQAIADHNEEVTHLFANTTYYKHSVKDDCYNGSFVAGSPTDNNGDFCGTFNCDVTGKDLSKIWSTDSLVLNETTISKFFGKMRNGVAQSRGTLGFDQFGRMRPGSANADGNDLEPRSIIDYSKNMLGDDSIELLALGSTQYDEHGAPYYYYVDTNGNGVRANWYTKPIGEEGSKEISEPQYDPDAKKDASCYTGKAGMRAHTYPSGHNAGAWTTTMLLMEMLPTKADKIYKAAYSYGVSRTIVRAHWNSDTIYGKYIAMMNVPIYHSAEVINASEDFTSPNVNPADTWHVRDEYITCRDTILAQADGCGSQPTSCDGSTSGLGQGNPVSNVVTTTNLIIGQWDKNDECTESWVVDRNRDVSGDCFIDLDSITFTSDKKIYGRVSVDNPETSIRSCKIPTKLGDKEDYFTIYQSAKEGGLGNLKFKVGLMSDIHMDVFDDETHYASDLANALGVFNLNGCSFVASCGDFVEYQTLDYCSFGDIYKNGGLKMYACLGNHDYYKLYSLWSKRYGDGCGDKDETILNTCGQSGSECGAHTDGSDPKYCHPYSDKKLAALWRTHIEKFGLNGENLHYFSNVAGSDVDVDETLCTRSNYTTSGYDFSSASLLQGNKDRKNYYFEKDNTIFVFMSIDYGVSTSTTYGEVSRGTFKFTGDERRTDAFEEMLTYVRGTGYNAATESDYDFKFYKPEVLIWLKNIIEARENANKMIFVFSHHFLPNKAGDADGIYSKINTTSSNALCGITFWFINKLNNEHKNVIWFSGHCHRVWIDSLGAYEEFSVCKHNYETSVGTLYRRGSKGDECGAWVSLPSLAKPISSGGSKLSNASQGGILEVYENGAKLLEYNFTLNDAGGYPNEVIKEEILYQK